MNLREFREQTGMVSPMASIDAQIGTEDNLEIQEIYPHIEDGHPYVTLVIGRDLACPSRNFIDADELWDRLQRAAKGDPSPDRTGYWDGFHDVVDIVKQMMEGK